jgi:hypothetical protein
MLPNGHVKSKLDSKKVHKISLKIVKFNSTILTPEGGSLQISNKYGSATALNQ